MRIEGLDEAVAHDEGFSELGREVQANNTHNAGRFASLVDLQNVVLSGQGVLVSADDEVEVGKVGHLSAVHLLFLAGSEGLGHVLDHLGWANEHGCSGIDNAQKVGLDLVAGSVEDDVVEGNGPVVVHLQSVILELSSVVLGVGSAQHQGRAVLAGDLGQVEGEGVS